jgi:saccharopine dehydrogenase-like NADP-dependent oxidoreductase
MRIVVVGGFGNFGARICRRLSLEPSVEIVAAGRHGGTASRASATRSAVLDIQSPEFAASLCALAPNLVIHCAGPFQGQDYRVVRASVACGAHYIDLADGRNFVLQFAEKNAAAAMDANCMAVSGASTVPGLSCAVVDHLKERFAQVEEVEIAIAPGQHAPRGTATMAAVLGYAGQGFKWLRDGDWQTVHGWQELRRIRFPFGTRYAAACDVPDLALFPARYPGVHTVSFRAALEVPIEHFALWAVAGLRRIGLPIPVVRLAGALDRVGHWLDRFGSDCGGMTVSVVGATAGDGRRRATWQLVAKSNHGPEIPCLPAVLLACKLARGEALPPGAQACMGLLNLADFEPEFERWSISTRIVEEPA